MRDNVRGELPGRRELPGLRRMPALAIVALAVLALAGPVLPAAAATADSDLFTVRNIPVDETAETAPAARDRAIAEGRRLGFRKLRSEEHTSELQSLMRISYAVFCLKKKTTTTHT